MKIVFAIALTCGMASLEVNAQVFDRQFGAVSSLDSGGNDRQQRALRQFVGKHAFKTGPLPVVGFFGCNAGGGSGCQSAPPKVAHEAARGDRGGDVDGPDDHSCP